MLSPSPLLTLPIIWRTGYDSRIANSHSLLLTQLCDATYHTTVELLLHPLSEEIHIAHFLNVLDHHLQSNSPAMPELPIPLNSNTNATFKNL